MRHVPFLFTLAAILAWLALPSLALADNCQNLGVSERAKACSFTEYFFGFFSFMAFLASGKVWRTWKKGAPPPGYLKRVPPGGLPGKDAGGGAGSAWRPAGMTPDGHFYPGTTNPRGPVPPESDPDPSPPPPPPPPPPGPAIS